MNKWRITGLVMVAALAAWLTLRSCTPQKPAPVSQPQPTREEFHASKPLRVMVLNAATSTDQATATKDDEEWLERELRYLLIRGRMRIAPVGTPGTTPFTLRIELPAEGQSSARMTLLAPRGEISRQAEVAPGAKDRLALTLAFAKQLPEFLGAAHATANWEIYVGMTEPSLYESFIRSSTELLGPHGHGFTQPAAADRSRAVQRLAGTSAAPTRT